MAKNSTTQTSVSNSCFRLFVDMFCSSATGINGVLINSADDNFILK